MSVLLKALLYFESSPPLRWRRKLLLFQYALSFPRFFKHDVSPLFDKFKFMAVVVHGMRQGSAIAVKQAACRVYCSYIRIQPYAEERHGLVARIRDLHQAQSYWDRMLFVDLCIILVELFSHRWFKKHMFTPCLSLAQDLVSNVRCKFCQVLPVLRTTLKLPGDVQWNEELSKIVLQLRSDPDKDVMQAAIKASFAMDRVELMCNENFSSLSSGLFSGTEAARDKAKQLEEDNWAKVEEELQHSKRISESKKMDGSSSSSSSGSSSSSSHHHHHHHHHGKSSAKRPLRWQQHNKAGSKHHSSSSSLFTDKRKPRKTSLTLPGSSSSLSGSKTPGGLGSRRSLASAVSSSNATSMLVSPVHQHRRRIRQSAVSSTTSSSKASLGKSKHSYAPSSYKSGGSGGSGGSSKTGKPIAFGRRTASGAAKYSSAVSSGASLAGKPPTAASAALRRAAANKVRRMSGDKKKKKKTSTSSASSSAASRRGAKKMSGTKSSLFSASALRR
jgi:hypothetical protein